LASVDPKQAPASIGNGGIANDLLASVVVFLVALPLCIGIAIASGVPPALGLVTGIVGGIVIGALAGSPLQVSGPAAGLAVLVWDLVESEGLHMLGVVVLAAGVLQMLAGVFRLGRWFRAVSPAVIQGMLSGIGVLIFANQFHVMVDDDPAGNGLENLISIPMAIYKGVNPAVGDRAHHIASGIGLLTIVSLIAWNQFKPKQLRMVPGPLVAVVLATAVAAVFAAPVLYVEVPANLLNSLNIPNPEDFGRLTEGKILGEAFAFAVIASAETLLCATAVDKLHDGPRTKYDKELLAQGVGNALCGAVGALPATGVIVRSSANVEAGAQTRMSAIIHGLWLLALVAFLPWVLETIPKAALAAILVYTGYKLLNPPAMKRLWETGGRSEIAIYTATLVMIVATDLLTGVIAGFALSIVKLVYTFTHLEIDVTESKEERRIDVALHGAATFVRLPDLAQTFEALPRGDWEVHVHIGGVAYVDHAMVEQLQQFEQRYEAQGGVVKIEWDDLDLRSGKKMHLKRQTLPAPELRTRTSARAEDEESQAEPDET